MNLADLENFGTSTLKNILKKPRCSLKGFNLILWKRFFLTVSTPRILFVIESKRSPARYGMILQDCDELLSSKNGVSNF